MPLTYQRTFRIRHYECDAHGFARYASYLNYMQEAAFDASAAAGYDRKHYDAAGQHWLVRETDIHYRQQLRYGESVLVKTWVADFRRVRSRRAYQLYLDGSGELVAEASTDWVFLDSRTGRPATIPAEMMQAFYPEGVPDKAQPRRRFPSTSPPSDGVSCLKRHVVWSDIDPAGHVNNAVYLAYLEDSEEQMAAACDWPRHRLAAEGIFLAASSHLIEYRQPAMLGDDLELTTWLSHLGEQGGTWQHAIARALDGMLLVRARTDWAWSDVETRRPAAVPAKLADDFLDGPASR